MFKSYELFLDISFKLIVVNDLKGLGETVNTWFDKFIFTDFTSVKVQLIGNIEVIASEVKAPAVVRARPFRMTPVLIAPNAPLLQMMVPQKTE
jgi:hypothetical protein